MVRERSDHLVAREVLPAVSCSVSPNKLKTSANNHKLVDIKVSINVTDGGSGPNGFKLISVTSSQADSEGKSACGILHRSTSECHSECVKPPRLHTPDTIHWGVCSEMKG
jgi:hypothetical protein